MMINLLSTTAHGYHSKIDNLFLFLTISTCNKKAIALTTCILFTCTSIHSLQNGPYTHKPLELYSMKINK